jgi:tetratricopeptide (TPR) repeat protein
MSTPTPLAAARPVAQCQRITLDDFFARCPQASPHWDEAATESLHEWLGDDEVLLIEGDCALDPQWLADFQESDAAALVVTGNASLACPPERLLWVGGDLHCHHFNGTHGHWLRVGGRMVATHHVSYWMEDDGITRQPPAMVIDTPVLYTWYFDVGPLVLPPTAVAFVMSHNWAPTHGACPVLNWHEAVHVLRDDCQSHVGADWHNTHCWDVQRIDVLRDQGESPYKPGIALHAAWPWQVDAADLLAIGEPQQAYGHYRRAAELSPGDGRLHLALGELLCEAGAYEQSLAHFERAAGLFPARQTGLVNEGLTEAARAAVRCRRLGDAVRWASLSIEHNRSAEEPKVRTMALRARGEALLLQGKWHEAEADLLAAADLDPSNRSVSWLLGLCAHHQGQVGRAQELHTQACERDARFTAPYEVHANTDFLFAPPVHVDWGVQPVPTTHLQRDATFWGRLCAAKGAEALHRVPTEMRTRSLCLALAQAAAPGERELVQAIPAPVIDPEIALALARLHADNLAHLPPECITREVCLATPVEEGGFSLSHVPAAVLDREVVRHALRCGEDLSEVPPQWVDEGMCMDAVQSSSDNIFQVPTALRTEKLWAMAVAHGGTWFIANKLPSRWRCHAVFKQAVALQKKALDQIPGKWFDAELFEHAQALYGEDEDWPDIISRHGQQACRDDKYSSCAKDCWSVFWDETFMLEQVARQAYQLSAYEIPERLFTPAIAKACFEREPIHLASIPKAFITDAMCERFIERYADMLADVPFARRTVEVCAVAVASELGQMRLVPAALHAQVMDRLLGGIRPGGDLAQEMQVRGHRPEAIEALRAVAPQRMMERARGWLMLDVPRVAQAQADLQAALLASQTHLHEIWEPSEIEAFQAELHYLLGYCAHLQGLGDAAQEHRAASGLLSAAHEYTSFDPRIGKQTADFDRQSFDEAMHMAEAEIEGDRLADAWAATQEAELLLRQAGQDDPYLWAHVLDKQRWLSFELERWGDNTAVCQAVVQRLEKVAVWAYSMEGDTVRHALRAALHRLAAIVLTQEPPAPAAQLEQALGQVTQAIGMRGPCEDEEATHGFEQTRAGLLLRLAAQNPSHAAALERALHRIERLGLVASGQVDDPLVLQALSGRHRPG